MSPNTSSENERIDICSTEHEYFIKESIESLDRMLNKLNGENRKFIIRGENVGWRNISSKSEVNIEDGDELLRKLCPDGKWKLTATLFENSIEIKISHHDSPTSETYTLKPRI